MKKILIMIMLLLSTMLSFSENLGDVTEITPTKTEYSGCGTVVHRGWYVSFKYKGNKQRIKFLSGHASERVTVNKIYVRKVCERRGFLNRTFGSGNYIAEVTIDYRRNGNRHKFVTHLSEDDVD